MPRGLYRKLHDDGVLLVDEGLRVSRPATLIDYLVGIGIKPEVIFCDRFALGTLKDAVAGRWPIVDRVARWSDATEDISGFRRLVADGPLSIAEVCRGLARLLCPAGVCVWAFRAYGLRVEIPNALRHRTRSERRPNRL